MDYNSLTEILDDFVAQAGRLGLTAREIEPRTNESWSYGFSSHEMCTMVIALYHDAPQVKGFISITGGAARGLRDDVRLYQEVATARQARAVPQQDGTVTVATSWDMAISPLIPDGQATGEFFYFMVRNIGSTARDLGANLIQSYGGRLLDDRPEDAAHLT